jgi:hypothetical protein
MQEEQRTRGEIMLESIVEGKKMEAYVEHCTKDMHVCELCGTVGYKKLPMRLIGKKWLCIDCLRQIKETLETMDQWDAEIELEKEMSMKIDETLGL